MVDIALGVVSGGSLVAESRLFGHTAHEVLAVVLGLAVAATIAARRRNPLLALIATLAVLLIALPITHSTHATLAIAMLSAATLAHQGRRVTSVVVGCALVPVVGLAWVIAGADNGGGGFVIYLALLLAAVAAGDAVRSRHSAAVARRDRERVAREAAAKKMFDQYRVELGRELHDSLAHTLVAIATRAGVATHLRGPDGDPELLGALEDVKEVSTAALQQLRATLHAVRDTESAPPLAPAQTARMTLHSLLMPLEASGIRVELDCDPHIDTAPESVRHAGLRIVQESLTNVLRHAQARSVRVSLSALEDQLIISVTNDGPVSISSDTAGHGLIGMHERATEIGGAVCVGPQPEGGWRVHARLPMAQSTQA